MMSGLKNLTAYELHKHLVNEYMLTNKGSTKLLTRDTSKDKRDIDVIKENHKFLWDDDPVDTWEKRLAKKYYDKLFKEYCICDLSRYKENKVALRWRTEQEVLGGKGQFECGHKRCTEKEGLKSWEVNFAYKEDGEKKNALVKLRLCSDCSLKLNHHTKKREVKRLKRKGKKSKDSRNKSKKSVSEDIEEVADDEPSVSATDTATTSEAINPDNEPWKKGNLPEEKSREDEFEEYLEELLL